MPGTNAALASAGAVATASSQYSSSYPVSAAINGDRYHLYQADGNYNVWHSASGAAKPDWLQVDFSGSKTIDEIDVVTLQDSYTNPSDPTEAMTFNQYGVTAYEVQYWNGSGWATAPGGSVTGNNKVWRKFSFTAVTTSKIRVLISATADTYSRLLEVEAWGNNAATPPPPTNVALASNGATASASSSYAGCAASGAQNSDRRGLNYHQDGTWGAASASFPQWLQIDFNGSKTIGEIDVFTLQDNYSNPSEPTEAMTFSLYGVTAFDVQYWNGNSWITVPGGSVTGNNKVWRKFTFTAITTSKIRVVTNASASGWSELTELEAWTVESGGGGSSAQIHWLVTDQLGTPRMVFDQSGSLANVSRHDYLPFGEEIYAGVGGRMPAQGYTGDGTRQKFTSYERDSETSLDFAQARYYSNGQGRFTRPDPWMASADEFEPQSWNRYAYVGNNPLAFTDPSGMFQNQAEDLVKLQLAQDPKKKPNYPEEPPPPMILKLDVVKISIVADRNTGRNLTAAEIALIRFRDPADMRVDGFDNADPGDNRAMSGALNIAGAAGTFGSRYIYQEGVFWRGTNGLASTKMFGPGPNQYTGARSIAINKAGALTKLGKVAGIAGYTLSGIQTVQAYRQGGLRAAVKPGVDTAFGVLGTHGGPWGAGASGVYFGVDMTIGWPKMGQTALDHKVITGTPPLFLF